MNSPESESAGQPCLCPQLDQFKAHAQSSEWSRAADLAGHLDSCWDLLTPVMDKAIADQQWDWAVHLFKKCQKGQQANRLVEELVNCAQWHGVVQLVEPQLSGEVLEGVVQFAVQQGQWAWIKRTVGQNAHWSPWLCQQAVDSGQWDLVLQLIERGVSAALRNSLLQSALGHHQVQCTATLMDLGVSKQCKEEGIRQQIAAGHEEFVLEVVRNVRDPDFTDFVLKESMKQSQWSLVSGLVKEGLGVAQMESVCDQAVADQQWNLVLQLLQDGVSPSEFIVIELFQNNKAQDLLDFFPAGGIPEGLKGLLLMASVRFHLGELALTILQRESVSDSQLMEALKYAIHLQDKTIFLQLVGDCPRACRVFKQKFVHQQWKESLQPPECDGGEVRWIYDELYEEGLKDLAFFVATSVKTSCLAIEDFCWDEWDCEQFCLKPKKFSFALRKLLEFDDENYCLFVEEMYKASETSQSNRSFLFRQTIQLGSYNLTHELCKFGVSRKDLMYAFKWLVQGGLDSEVFALIPNELRREEAKWLQQFAVNMSMKEYFENQSDSNLNIFMEQFNKCRGGRFARQVFRKGVRKCVELDCADCFVILFKNHKTGYGDNTSYAEVRKDRRFALVSVVNANRSHFVSKLDKNGRLYHDEMLLLMNIIIKREAWHMLGDLYAELKHLSFGDRGVRLLTRCVLKMLRDQSVWSKIAPALEQWIRGCSLKGNLPMKRVASLKAKIAAVRRRTFSVSDVMQWCVDSCHVNLAFFLALVTEDVETLTTVVTTLPCAVCLNDKLLWAALGLASERRQFSACVAVLKLLPLEGRHCDQIEENWKRSRHLTWLSLLASACEEQDLLDWALLLMADSAIYVLEKHQRCQNPGLLNFILKKAVKDNAYVWNVAKALTPRCVDLEVLYFVLVRAIWCGQKTLAEELVGRVDPADGRNFHSDILWGALVNENPEVRVEMVSLCISSGLATFERQRKREYYDNPLLKALEKLDLKVVKLLLASGAFSQKHLESLWDNDEIGKFQTLVRLENNLSYTGRENSKQWKIGHRWIIAAAATPLRLEHMAQLVASHSIGCQPGRSDRIDSLPVPEPIKDLLNFKDIVNMDLSRVEEEEEGL